MSISRQHLEALAEVIREADYLNDYQRGLLANDVVSALRPFNPRIDRARFTRAALPEQRE